jgi:NAD(P)-dependent dehydrogenase (short-subunit alcohol dehydrogenase family)
MEKAIAKVALVTGANKGIGFEIARQLARRGIMALMGARDAARGEAAVERLKQEGLPAWPLVIDVTDPAGIAAASARVDSTFGRLDILVNNAGILVDFGVSIADLSAEALQRTLSTNTIGPLLVCQAFLPLMKRNGYGRIVNIASTLGSLTEMADPASPYAVSHSPAYRLSKAALNAVTGLLAIHLRGSNILVNSACPGWVRTDLGGPQAPLSPEEGADTPVWLATLPDGGPNGGFFRERRSVPW